MPSGRFAFSGVEVANSPDSHKCEPRSEKGDSIGAFGKCCVFRLGTVCDLYTSGPAEDCGAQIASLFAPPGPDWSPPTMNTDASQGFSRADYECALIAMIRSYSLGFSRADYECALRGGPGIRVNSV